jgi:hypothetical protein
LTPVALIVSEALSIVVIGASHVSVPNGSRPKSAILGRVGAVALAYGWGHVIVLDQSPAKALVKPEFTVLS